MNVPTGQEGIYRATLCGLQRAIEGRRQTLVDSLWRLPDQAGDYAEVHRAAIAVHDGLIITLDAKIAAAGGQ